MAASDDCVRHGEYKIPGGKLVVVDLFIQEGRLQHVQLSGDFFLEPPEALDDINQALNGLPAHADAARIEQAVTAALPPGTDMFGLSAAGIAEVIRRAVA